MDATLLLLFQSYLIGGLIAELRHMYVLDAQSFRPMRRPLYGHLIVKVRPFWVMSLGFAFLRYCIHELPRIVECLEQILSLEPFFRRRELPSRQQWRHSVGQVVRLVCGEADLASPYVGGHDWV